MDPRTYEKIDSIPIDSVYTPIAIDLGEYVDEDTKDTLRPYYIITPEDVLGLRMPREMEEIKGEDPFFEPMAAAAGTGGGGLGGQQGLPPPQAIYYLYDHLGNTRITFHADVCTGSGTGISYYLDQVADYFPYGKLLREYRSSSLVITNGIGQMVQQAPERYLTTQHERDEESGFDYRGARFYDSDLGRFLSVDPLAADYAGWSGYNYVLGNPIRFIDPDGRKVDDIILIGSSGIQVQWTNGGDLLNLTNGGFYKGNDKFICEVANDLNLLHSAGDSELKRRIDILDGSNQLHYIEDLSKGGIAQNTPYENGPDGLGSYKAERNQKTGSITYYSPFDNTQGYGKAVGIPESTLAHELLGHGYQNDQGYNGTNDNLKTDYGVKKVEVDAVQMENRANDKLGAEKRTEYGGKSIPKKDQ